MLAELAIEPALHLLQQTNGTVYLMRVPVYGDSGAQTTPEYHRVWAADNDLPEHEDAAAYLRDARENISRPGVTVRTIVGEGERSNAIANTAVMKNADLIAMTTHARTGVSRWLLGSVAGKVIRQAQSPIMLVRHSSRYNHILVTLDGSELAERIIEAALALAAGYNSRVTFLQVADAGKSGLRRGAGTATDDESSEPGGETYLEEIISRYENSGLEIDAIIMGGPVAGSILAYAAENNVDLIAMSTHGRSGLRKLIFGSVTEKIMCDSGCAMLIVRPPDQELS